MHTYLKRAVSVTVVLLALSVILAMPALAEGGPARRPGHWGWGPMIPNPSFGQGIYADVDYETAAKVLSMEVEDLKAQIWAGTTLAALAEKAGVEVTALQTEIEAARYRLVTGGIKPPKGDAPDGKVELRTTAWNGLNLRTGPGTGYHIWATVPHGTIVYVADGTSCVAPWGWVEVEYRGHMLWAWSAYLRP